jgi:hypothetical protein
MNQIFQSLENAKNRKYGKCQKPKETYTHQISQNRPENRTKKEK